MSVDLTHIMNSASAFLTVQKLRDDDLIFADRVLETNLIVSRAVRARKLIYQVYPGMLIEQSDLEIGTPAAALFMSPREQGLEPDLTGLRDDLGQTEIFIAAPGHPEWPQTKAFNVNFGNVSMHTLSEKWHQAATAEYNRTGRYIGGALYSIGNDILAQGEMNPAHINDPKMLKDYETTALDQREPDPWYRSVMRVMEGTKPGTSPFKRTVGYKHLYRAQRNRAVA